MFGRKRKVAPYVPPVFDYPEWYTPNKLHLCPMCNEYFQYEINLRVHTAYAHPKEKENTMNTYTITVNGITERPIQGTGINTIGGGLRILDGDNVVAAYKTWDSYRVERDVDKTYVDKINELENNLKDTWEVVSELEKMVTSLEAENERNTTTITELRKQRNEYKQKLNSVYGRSVQGVGACDKEYTTFFSGGVLGKSPCIYRHGHNGAHKTANGDVWVSAKEYVDTDSMRNKCVERTELRWDGEPLIITCRRERCHEGRHSAVQVGYLW